MFSHSSDLNELLLIALCAILVGGNWCSDIALFSDLEARFLRQSLHLWPNSPSHGTLNRVFSPLNPDPFKVCIHHFMHRCDGTLDAWRRSMARRRRASTTGLRAKARRMHFISRTRKC